MASVTTFHRAEAAHGAVDAADAVTPVEETLALLGRRWTVGILCLLGRGRMRYNALMRELRGATPKMLTQQLRTLEHRRLIVREQFLGGAKHTEYALTPAGEQLLPIVEALDAWTRRDRQLSTSDVRVPSQPFEVRDAYDVRRVHRAD